MFEIRKPDTGDKKKFYHDLIQALTDLIAGESDWLANICNASALLFQWMSDINWAGFYFLKAGQLVLGPFQGKPACIRIPPGKGVCGTAATERKTQVVPDVHDFPGHIACDEASRSEIVVPMIKQGRLIGVLDIDSPVPGRFDEEDAAGLQNFVDVINRYVVWPEELGEGKAKEQPIC